MKMSLFFLLVCCLTIITATAQTNAEQLAASFDKSKIKHKSKYGVQVRRELITRHEVVNVADLTFYQGRYVGIEGVYEVTLTPVDQRLTGQLIRPNSSGKPETTALSNIHIADGVFSAKAGEETIKGVFINQGRVDNEQEQISFGLGIIDPQLTTQSINYDRIFCVRK